MSNKKPMPPKKRVSLPLFCLLTVGWLGVTVLGSKHAHADATPFDANPFDVLQHVVATPPSDTVAYRFPGGAEYTGEWKNGLPHGDGQLKLANGSMYLGAFEKGMPEGTGIFQEAQGDLYRGEWHQGLRDGLGIMEYANGNRYEGQWKNNLREGAGSLFFPSGTRFEGLWKRDMRHGRGSLLQKTGETYSGDYAKDVPHGYGTAVESDGSIYAGTFSKGKKHGVGDCTGTGGLSETCVFDKGVRISNAAVVSRANNFKTRHEPQFQFSEGVALLWEDNFSKGKGIISEEKIIFTKRAAMLGSELKLESRGQNFFLLLVVPNYKGPGKYRLSGEDIVVSLDGETPLFLSGSDAGQLDITSDKDTLIEGELAVPKLYAEGVASKKSVAVKRGQFKALPSHFQALQNAAETRPPMASNFHLKKSTSGNSRSHKPLINGRQPGSIEELIQKVDKKGQEQRSDDAVEPHGKR